LDPLIKDQITSHGLGSDLLLEAAQSSDHTVRAKNLV
jgi:hypothetical protein